MDSPAPYERFEAIRSLLDVALSNRAANVASADPLDLEFALRRYIEAVDGIVTQLQLLREEGVLVDISVFLALQFNPGPTLQ